MSQEITLVTSCYILLHLVTSCYIMLLVGWISISPEYQQRMCCCLAPVFFSRFVVSILVGWRSNRWIPGPGLEKYAHVGTSEHVVQLWQLWPWKVNGKVMIHQFPELDSCIFNHWWTGVFATFCRQWWVKIHKITKSPAKITIKSILNHPCFSLKKHINQVPCPMFPVQT